MKWWCVVIILLIAATGFHIGMTYKLPLWQIFIAGVIMGIISGLIECACMFGWFKRRDK